MKFSDENKKTSATPEQIKYTKPLELAKPKKKKWGIFVIIGLLIIIIGGIAFVAFKGIQLFEKIGLKIDSNSLSLTNKEPELQKDSTGKHTNFLIVGIDTRPNSGGLNTDTIMEVSYNYDTHNMVMVSVPRDLTVEIGKGSNWYNKINSVYAFTEAKTKGTGLQSLKETVEAITGTQIQYYAMVNYEGFVKIVDTVGGIDVNVTEAFTDTCYPADSSSDTGAHYGFCIDSEGYWKTVSFKKGVQTMDGKTALEYSRSRHGTYDVSKEGVSDYGRALHQQQVLLALKDKILSTSTLTSPKTIMGIISSVSDNIKVSQFTVSDIQAGIDIIKAFSENNGKSYSFVMSPEAGNGNVIANANTYGADGKITAYRIAPKLGLGKYTDTAKFVAELFAKPQLYNENATIYVYNTGLGATDVTKKVQTLKTTYPFLNIVYKGTMFSDKEGNYIYTNKENEFSATIEELGTYLAIENKTKPDYITTQQSNGDVTILFGKEVTTQLTQQ